MSLRITAHIWARLLIVYSYWAVWSLSPIARLVIPFTLLLISPLRDYSYTPISIYLRETLVMLACVYILWTISPTCASDSDNGVLRSKWRSVIVVVSSAICTLTRHSNEIMNFCAGELLSLCYSDYWTLTTLRSVSWKSCTHGAALEYIGILKPRVDSKISR